MTNFTRSVALLFLLVGLVAPRAQAQCVDVNVEIQGSFASSNEISWSLRNVTTGALVDSAACGTITFGLQIWTNCLTVSDQYVFRAYDMAGNGWDFGGNFYTLRDVSTSCVISTGVPNNGVFPPLNPFSCIDNDLEEEVYFSLGDFEGCSDPLALNYDPCVTIDNGTCVYPAANDVCAQAIPLVVSDSTDCSLTSYLGTNIGAMGDSTSGAPPIAPACSDPNNYPDDVWFTAVIPDSGVIEIDWMQTPGSSMVIDVYEGTCGALTYSTGHSCNHYFPFNTATINGTPGSTIYLRVWDWGSDLTGTFEFCARDPKPGPASCSSTNPPTGLSSVVGGSSVTVSWNAVAQSVACQVQGQPVGAPGWANVNLIAFEPTSTVVPFGALTPGTTYNWRVRCACSISPLDATPLSGIEQFTTPALRKVISDAQALGVKLYPVPADRVLQIEIESLIEGEFEAVVYDALGRRVDAQSIALVAGNNTFSVEVGEWPEGAYVLEIGELSTRRPFVVSR